MTLITCDPGEEIFKPGLPKTKYKCQRQEQSVEPMVQETIQPMSSSTKTEMDPDGMYARGSQNVNKTFDDIEDGVDVEMLADVDIFTGIYINSEEDLSEAVEN